MPSLPRTQIFKQPVWLSALLLVVFSISACSGKAADATAELPGTEEPVVDTRPNVLLIIADDQGLDASSQYSVSQDLPNTPVIDQLAAKGIVFDNAWATPSCTTTRGSIITGKHGINSGIQTTPFLMDASTLTLQRYLKTDTASPNYSSAVIGKWHLAGADTTQRLDHPTDSGVDYYAGTISGTIDSYYDWPLTTGGITTQSDVYHPTAMTDLAINWLQQQTTPWFLWMAYVSPHSPFHLPPASLQTRSLSGDATDIENNPRQYYLAAIEAMDAEIGRLLASMSEETRDNTLIIFIGDNGTPRAVIDTAAFPRTHGKDSLYEGGVRIPMVASGAGVSRKNVREAALVNTVDIFATVSAVVGLNTPADIDGVSFQGLFDGSGTPPREFNYTEFVDDAVTGWTVRSDDFKLIEFADGTRELYRVRTDLREEVNLIADATTYASEIAALEGFAQQVRGSTNSTLPGSGVDITGVTLTSQSTNCTDYANSFTSLANDVGNNAAFSGSLQISVTNGSCVFETNAIPNHDFNDVAQTFPNNVAPQVDQYTVSASPVVAGSPTALSLTRDNAVLLNGVKIDLLAAACFEVGDGRVGCNDPAQPWRYDPMHVPNGFRVDSHNAHTQPDGTYHYHGLPNALFVADSSTVSPVVGFAADGFAIFGTNIEDNGVVRPVQSSYRLKSGSRPTGAGNPGGVYDGTYRDDYEYVAGAGDLDECNGMLVNGSYRYHMTARFPHVIACFKGTPDDSFIKRN